MASINDKFVNFLNSVVGNEPDKIISQVDLGNQVNCTSVSMSRYLNKKREIPVRTLFEIKKALNISDEMFMKFYAQYSSKGLDTIDYAELYAKFLKLSDENKVKLMDYIDYLIYTQTKEQEDVRRFN